LEVFQQEDLINRLFTIDHQDRIKMWDIK